MATVIQEFQSAPMGKRVLIPTVISFAAVVLVLLVNLLIAFKAIPKDSATDRVALAVSPFVVLGIVLPMFLFERSKVSRFRIDENCLVLGKKRFPLQGAVEVRRDPDAMKWAIKLFANGGLGSLRGSFRSRRLGKFYAFMTGTENAVVVRWPDKTVVVSPADPEFFIYSARSAAGIR
jgi:hypothetical protein